VQTWNGDIRYTRSQLVKQLWLSLAKPFRRDAGRVLDFAWVADAFLRTRPRITGILAESGSGCDLVRRNASSLMGERPASRFSPIRTRR
jgi:hypothetical protein